MGNRSPDASAFPGKPPSELPDERGGSAWWWGDARDDDEAAFWQKREISRLWRAAL